MTPRQVVPYLLGAPPHLSMVSLDPAGNRSFACPSDQVPHCWLDPTKVTSQNLENTTSSVYHIAL